MSIDVHGVSCNIDDNIICLEEQCCSEVYNNVFIYCTFNKI